METMQSKTLKAIDFYGKPVDIKTIAGLINNNVVRTKKYLQALHDKGLVEREIIYKKEFNKVYPVAYYQISQSKDKRIQERIKYWLEHF